MDLDELKEKWEEHDRKLDASLRLNRQLLNEVHLDRARSALHRLTLSLAFEAAIDFVAVAILGAFLYDHIAVARFALPAVVLDVYAIAILIAVIRQITAVQQIDYGKPITTIQKQVEALRILRIRCIQGTLLAAPLVWTPLFIVALKGLFGLDAYRLFGTAWLLANLLFGLAVIPLALWLSRRFRDRLGRSPAMRRLIDDLTGHSLNRAADFLKNLTEFEDEENHL